MAQYLIKPSSNVEICDLILFFFSINQPCSMWEVERLLCDWVNQAKRGGLMPGQSCILWWGPLPCWMYKFTLAKEYILIFTIFFKEFLVSRVKNGQQLLKLPCKPPQYDRGWPYIGLPGLVTIKNILIFQGLFDITKATINEYRNIIIAIL